jgi:hypothetical protein
MTIVAFLLAGFTVLATVTKPALFAELAQITHEDRNGRPPRLTELEFIFFVFLNVFVHYVSFLLFCTVFVLFGTKNGPLAMVLLAKQAKSLSALHDPLRRALFVVMGTWLILLVLKLKSFIWNVYQVVVVVIVTDRETVT